MKYIIERLGSDYKHWKVLHSLTLAQVKCGISSWATTGFGRKRSSKGARVLYYFFVSIMAINTYNITVGLGNQAYLYPTTMTFLNYQLSSFFVLFIISIVFGEVFISNEDYEKLGYRPISTKSYFLSKYTAILLYTSTVTIIMSSPTCIVFLFSIKIWSCLTYIITNLIVQIFVAFLTIFVFLKLARRSIIRGRNPPIKLYGALFGILSLIPTFVWYLPEKFDMLYEFSRTNQPIYPPLWLEMVNPFAWFASVPALANGNVAISTLIGTLLALSVTTLLYLVARRYTGLEFLNRVQLDLYVPHKNLEYAPGALTIRSISSKIWFSDLRNHPMWTLLLAHTRSNRKYRTTLLWWFFCPLYILIIALISRSIGEVGLDRSSLHSGSLGLIYFALIGMSLGITRHFTFTTEYRASWILFTSPYSLNSLCLFSCQLFRIFVILPYVLLLFIVAIFCDLFPSWYVAFKQILIVSLLLDLLFKVKSGLEFNVPFTQGPEAMGRLFHVFVAMLVAGIISPTLLVILPICTGSLELFAASVIVMVVLSLIASWGLRRHFLHREKQLEFVA